MQDPTTAPDRHRRARDLVTGLIVVALAATVAALPALIAHDATGRAPAWAWLPLLLPAGLLAVLVTNWCRGGYLPPACDDADAPDRPLLTATTQRGHAMTDTTATPADDAVWDVPCEDPEDCPDCDGSGDDGCAPNGCYTCGGTGAYISPNHCCVCGDLTGYCQCCSKCGYGNAGSCACPRTVQLQDGGTLTL